MRVCPNRSPLATLGLLVTIAAFSTPALAQEGHPAITPENAAEITALTLLRAESDSGVWCLAWSPDGSAIAAGGNDDTVWVWDVEAEALRSTRQGDAGLVLSVAWSPDGEQLASGTRDGSGRIWAVDTPDATVAIGVRIDEQAIFDAVWAAEGADKPDVKKDNYLEKVELAQRQVQAAIAQFSIKSVAWSPAGDVVAAASGNAIHLWDATTGAELAVLAGHTGLVRSVAWSPDGSRLASAGNDKVVRLWDAESGAVVAALTGHEHPITSVGWSPDGGRLASGSRDDVRVWNAETGEPLAVLAGHTEWVRAVAWSPDGSMLATGSEDNTVRLWDAATGTELAALGGITDMLGVAWSPAGTRLASTGPDGRIWLWGVPNREG